MSPFEFAFSLFSLLLGLSLAEVLGGFARSVDARRSARLGWLTPMLALVVLMDIVSFWASAWLIRDQINISFPSMLGATAFAGAYYVGAYLVFPQSLIDGESLDTHYLWARRPVFGIIAAANVVQFFVFFAIKGWPVLNQTSILVQFAIFELLSVANMFTRGSRVIPVVLAITVALYLVNLLS